MKKSEQLAASVRPFIGSKMNGGIDDVVAAHARDIDRAFEPLILTIKRLLSIHQDPQNAYQRKVYDNAQGVIDSYK